MKALAISLIILVVLSIIGAVVYYFMSNKAANPELENLPGTITKGGKINTGGTSTTPPPAPAFNKEQCIARCNTLNFNDLKFQCYSNCNKGISML